MAQTGKLRQRGEYGAGPRQPAQPPACPVTSPDVSGADRSSEEARGVNARLLRAVYPGATLLPMILRGVSSLLTNTCYLKDAEKPRRVQDTPLPGPPGRVVCLPQRHSHLRPEVTKGSGPAASESSSGSESAGAQAHVSVNYVGDGGWRWDATGAEETDGQHSTRRISQADKRGAEAGEVRRVPLPARAQWPSTAHRLCEAGTRPRAGSARERRRQPNAERRRARRDHDGGDNQGRLHRRQLCPGGSEATQRRGQDRHRGPDAK